MWVSIKRTNTQQHVYTRREKKRARERANEPLQRPINSIWEYNILGKRLLNAYICTYTPNAKHKMGGKMLLYKCLSVFLSNGIDSAFFKLQIVTLLYCEITCFGVFIFQLSTLSFFEMNSVSCSVDLCFVWLCSTQSNCLFVVCIMRRKFQASQKGRQTIERMKNKRENATTIKELRESGAMANVWVENLTHYRRFSYVKHGVWCNRIRT